MSIKFHFRSFVTGSYAYGVPTNNSDIDVVILVSERDLERLKPCHTKMKRQGERLRRDELYAERGCYSLRFGNLNLLCCLNQDVFNTWRNGTNKLKKQAPVPRTFACRFFDKLWIEAGLHKNERPYHDEGSHEDIPF